MNEIDDDINDVVRQALMHFHIPENAEVLLFGSLAEGLGDTLSDVDLLIIHNEAIADPRFRQPTWIGERRVEIYSRSIDSLNQFSAVLNAASKEDIWEIIESGGESAILDDLDFYHRLLHAVPIARTKYDLAKQAQDNLSKDKIIELKVAVESMLCQRNIEFGRAFAAADLKDRSDRHFQVAKLNLVTAWSASKGETYPSNKFILEKLIRAGLDSGSVEEVMRSTLAFAPQQMEVNQIERFWRDLGLEPSAAMAKPVLCNDLDVICLEDQSWIGNGTVTLIVGGARLSDYGDLNTALCGDQAGQWQRVLFEAGFLTFEARGLRLSEYAPWRVGPLLPRLTCNGFDLGDLPYAIIPRSHRDIVQDVLAIIKCGFICANRREDAIGAIRSERWRILYSVMNEMVREIVNAILLSRGFPQSVSLKSIIEQGFNEPSLQQLSETLNLFALTYVNDRASACEAVIISEKIFSFLPEDVFGALNSSMATAQAGHAFLGLQLLWGTIANRYGIALPFVEREWQDILDRYQGSLNDFSELSVIRRGDVDLSNWSRGDSLTAELGLGI